MEKKKSRSLLDEIKKELSSPHLNRKITEGSLRIERELSRKINTLEALRNLLNELLNGDSIFDWTLDPETPAEEIPYILDKKIRELKGY